MERTVTHLFDNRDDAVQAVHELESMGVPASDISMIASNRDSWYGGDDRESRADRTGKGAATGATTGGVLGAGAGLLAGLGLMSVPGIGPVVAAGWLASTAAAAAAGAVGGGAVGGLIGALTRSGVPEKDAHVYAEGVRRGGTLVTVRTDDTRMGSVELALSRNNPADLRTREREYRAAGWSGFDDASIS